MCVSVGRGGGGGDVVIQCCPTLSQSQGSGMFLGRGGGGHDLFTKLPFTFPLLLDCRHILDLLPEIKCLWVLAQVPHLPVMQKRARVVKRCQESLP